jgi:hypothetical protein
MVGKTSLEIELRCHIFVTKKGDLLTLPPTEDAFEHHMKRGFHQYAYVNVQLNRSCKTTALR